MATIILHPGCVGDYDGAYDWHDTDQPLKPGWYGTEGWPGESFLVLEIPEENIPPLPHKTIMVPVGMSYTQIDKESDTCG